MNPFSVGHSGRLITNDLPAMQSVWMDGDRSCLCFARRLSVVARCNNANIITIMRKVRKLGGEGGSHRCS